MTAPRGLTGEEQALWEKLAATVRPLRPLQTAKAEPSKEPSSVPDKPTRVQPPRTAVPTIRREPTPPDKRETLDGSWDRKLKSGSVAPDITIDLHGHGLDGAYRRLMGGLTQARAMQARTILLVTGKPRAVDPADRGTKRGAIRAKVLDWLAASEHHAAIAAVRKAHIRHGGEGALYIVLRRGR